MCNTEIGYFCSQYEDWFEILSAPPFNLKIKRDGPYVMFNYDQISSDFNHRIVQEARGIIFRNGEWEHPVCWAFNKFGNYGESYVPEIDWDTAWVTEKIDGSLIKVWWDGDWKVSTNGTIDAWKAEIGDIKMSNFGAYFSSTVVMYYYKEGFAEEFLAGLNTKYTYMFELVGPYNRVVVPYEKPAIYFLGARNNHTGVEFKSTSYIAGNLGVGKFKIPTLYPINSLSECIKATEEFSWDQEGFVVCDRDFNRVKVKSPAYVLAHFMRNNNVITKKHLIRIIMLNEVEEFMCYASDYKEELKAIQKQMNLFIKLGDKFAETCRAVSANLERSDYARLVKTFPEMYHGLLFYNYERNMTMTEYSSKWNESKWEKYLIEFKKLSKEYCG